MNWDEILNSLKVNANDCRTDSDYDNARIDAIELTLRLVIDKLRDKGNPWLKHAEGRK